MFKTKTALVLFPLLGLILMLLGFQWPESNPTNENAMPSSEILHQEYTVTFSDEAGSITIHLETPSKLPLVKLNYDKVIAQTTSNFNNMPL